MNTAHEFEEEQFTLKLQFCPELSSGLKIEISGLDTASVNKGKMRLGK